MTRPTLERKACTDVGSEPDNSLLRPLVKSGLRPYTNVRNAAYVCRLRTCFFTPVNLLRVPSPVWPNEKLF